jgi:hypothetical protein
VVVCSARTPKRGAEIQKQTNIDTDIYMEHTYSPLATGCFQVDRRFKLL